MSGTTNLYDTATMVNALNQMLPVGSFLTKTFFGGEPTVSISKKVHIDIHKGKRRLSSFNNRNNPAVTVEKRGFTTREYEPAYMSNKIITRAIEELQRGSGEILYMDKSASTRSEEKLGEELAELKAMIDRRIEWMAAQVLQTGIIPVIGEGVDYELDFDMLPDHLPVLSGTDLWSDPLSNPLADFREWRRLTQKDSGIQGKLAILGEDALEAFLNNPNVLAQLDNRGITQGKIEATMRDDGSSDWGKIGDLQVVSYDEWYIDDLGVERPMIDPKKVIIGSPNAYTRLHYGAIETEGKLASTPFWPDQWLKKDPDRNYLRVQSAPITALHQSDAFLCAQVLA